MTGPSGVSNVATSRQNSKAEALLAVSEIYGPVHQGEGRHIGEPRLFLRLAGCNLSCTWCDTPFTWDWKGKNGKAYNPLTEIKSMTVTDVMHEITKVHWGKRQPGLVISGGEPLLQTRALQTLLVELYSLDFFVEIETNGTLVPTFPVFMVGSFNVSPKLRSSGNLIGVRRNFEALKWFVNRAVGRASFKFVCSDEADLREVDDIVRVTEMPPDSVYIMPEGVDPTELIQKAAILSDPVLQRRYNMTTRLHILTFGNQRGT